MEASKDVAMEDVVVAAIIMDATVVVMIHITVAILAVVISTRKPSAKYARKKVGHEVSRCWYRYEEDD